MTLNSSEGDVGTCQKKEHEPIFELSQSHRCPSLRHAPKTPRISSYSDIFQIKKSFYLVTSVGQRRTHLTLSDIDKNKIKNKHNND